MSTSVSLVHKYFEYVDTCMCTNMYTQMCVSVYVNVYTCVGVHMYACVCVIIHCMNMESRLSYITLPCPVTGSHPFLASNPPLQQYADLLSEEEQQLLLPIVISLYFSVLFTLYNVGFIKPTVPSPIFSLSAFINDIIPAKTGVEADVP